VDPPGDGDPAGTRGYEPDNGGGRGPRLRLAPVILEPMGLQRMWPLPVLGAAVVAAGFAMARGEHAGLPLAVPLLGLAMYLVVSRLPLRLSVPSALASGLALGGALLYAAQVTRSPPLDADAVESFLPLGAAWFIGNAVAARRRYESGLAEQAKREWVENAERARREVRDERVRIARELHDVIAHTMAVMTVQAAVGRRLMGKRPEEASSSLKSIEAIGRTAQEELRVVLGLLRDDGNGAAELSPAPRLADVKELAETVRASGTPVELRMTGADRQLSPALELSIYRVVQEALTNVVKHAPQARAIVGVLISDASVRIEIADNGKLAGEHAGRHGEAGHGIVGMRERIAAFGGWLVAEPFPDGGFRVLAEVPIDGAHDDERLGRG
jgi:signal transduction histidine kinase